jgi:cytochrome bd ubiquinol oxidase subunit I
MDAATGDVLFARGQMAYSLGFHIVFAAIGIAMPLLMVMAEIVWRRTGRAEYLDLARRWAKGTAVFFAIGAVSGTVLSFELGLLFPRFMELAGPFVGMPFSLEGIAFFTEAIFLGLYLYGWDRLRPALHIACGVVVAVSGALSAVFVTLVNAWMNAPRGFRLEGGAIVDIDPVAALGSPFAFHEIVHGLIAAYMACAMAVAAIHAWALLKVPGAPLHRAALKLAIAVAVPCALAQPIVGHVAGQVVAEHQPLKLAAMEGLERTQAGAPAHLGPIAIPGGLSLLAFNDPDAVVRGLEEFPAADRPHGVVRIAFQVMVILGSAAAGWAGLTVLLWIIRRRVPDAPPERTAMDLDGSLRGMTPWAPRWWLWATAALGPAGAIALEAGWVVTEVGRQPWAIYGLLRTNDAVTPVTGLWVPFTIFALIYIGLAAAAAAVLVRQVRQTTSEKPR